jgi:hypothetical protein
VFQQPINYAKAAPSETMLARLVAFDEAGGERVLGEYTFIPTRTMPDPGAWQSRCCSRTARAARQQ